MGRQQHIFSPFPSTPSSCRNKSMGGERQTKPRNNCPGSGPLGKCICFVISFIENVGSLIDIVGKKSDFTLWWTGKI